MLYTNKKQRHRIDHLALFILPLLLPSSCSFLLSSLKQPATASFFPMVPPPHPPSPPPRPSHPPPSFSICLVNDSPSHPSPSFKLSPSQQAYCDALSSSSPSLSSPIPAAKPGKAVRVQSDGKQLMCAVTEARKLAAGRGRATRRPAMVSEKRWTESESFGGSWEDVTAAMEGLLRGEEA